MFITKKHIARRTFLRGAGVALALPFLDSMVSAQTPLSHSAAAAKMRFMGIFFPHGMAPGYWVPKTTEPGFELPMILEPLEPFRNQTIVTSGLYSKSAEPPPGVTGADHWVAAAYLCANKPKKTAGSDIYDGTTIDQIIADKIGQDTLMPSVQLGIEDPTGNSSNCGEGYSCAYTNSISWQSPTKPLPTEINPQVVFERMFGDGSNNQERIDRRRLDGSILDAITASLASFKADIGPSDRQRLDEYVEDVREIERRLQIAAKASTTTDVSGVTVPAGVPESFDEHIKLQYDLQLLAFRSDVTRVSTLLYGRDLTGRVFPDSGTNISWHGGSHHGEDPKKIAEYAKLNRYHVQCLAYFLDKMQKAQDGDGSLLDHSLILYGTNMGDSHQHLHYDVPHILVGGACGQLKGGRHLAYPSRTITTGNLLLSILDLYGIRQEQIGDSTGTLPNLV